MPYSPPTRSVLKTSLRRDLRDENTESFSSQQLNDFINAGIAELNQIRPIETRVVYQGDQDFTQALPFSYVFSVELAIERNVGDTLHWALIHPANTTQGYERSGWEYFGRRLLLPGTYAHGIENLVDRYTAAQVYIAIWGYGERDPLDNDGDVAPFEGYLDEMIVRAYAQAEGMRALDADRALFAQWQAAASNSDVSATQLTQMLVSAQSEFDRMRKRHFIIRRPQTG